MPRRSFRSYSLVWYLGLTILVGTMPAMGPLFPATAAGAAAEDDGVELAILTLAGASRLASSMVGYGSATSPEGAAWRLLARRPDARVYFTQLLHEAGSVGQLYSLVWLRDADSRSFEKEAARLTPANRPVEVQRGCVIETRTFEQVVADIRAGDWGIELRAAPPPRIRS
jgi:hypothetical protein